MSMIRSWLRSLALLLALGPVAASAQQLDASVQFRAGASNGIGKLSVVAPEADGTFWALEAEVGRIHLFDAQGKLVRSIGKRGGGAGELSGEHAMVVAVGSNLYVLDIGNRRVMVLSPDGSVLKSSELDVTQGAPIGWGPLGTRLMYGVAPLPAEARAMMGGPEQHLFLSRDPLTDVSPDTIFRLALPDATSMSMDGAQISISMDLSVPRAVFGTDGKERVLIGTTDAYRLRIFDGKGKPLGTVERQVARRRYTEAELKRLRVVTDSNITAGFMRGAAMSSANIPMPSLDIKLPEFAPQMTQVFGLDSIILVRRDEGNPGAESAPVTWDVLGYDGSYRGSFTLPAGVNMAAAAGNRLWTIEADGAVAVRVLKTPG